MKYLSSLRSRVHRSIMSRISPLSTLSKLCGLTPCVCRKIVTYNAIITLRKLLTYADDFFVDLSRSHTFAVRVLAGSHFEHAHAEGVDVDSFVVVFLVHFRRHKFRCANHRFGKRSIFQCGQTQVANFDATRRSRNKNVVALLNLNVKLIHKLKSYLIIKNYLEVTVDDGWSSRMEEIESL